MENKIGIHATSMQDKINNLNNAWKEFKIKLGKYEKDLRKGGEGSVDNG